MGIFSFFSKDKKETLDKGSVEDEGECFFQDYQGDRR